MTANTKSNRSEKFWDLITKRYARAPVSNQEAYEKKLEIARGRAVAKSHRLL